MNERSAVNDRNFKLSHAVSTENATFDFHSHDGFEIYYFISGEVQYYIEDERYSLVSGDLLVIPAGRLHRLVTVDERVTYDRMVLSLSMEYCKKLMRSVPDNFVHHITHACHIPLGENSELRQMFYRLLELSADAAGALERDAMVTVLLLWLHRQISKATHGSTGDHRMQEIIRYINAHFTEPLTLEDIAERFFISKYHLLRLFKNYTHSTPHDYILEKRVLLAKALLGQGIAPSKVATDCGWSTYAGFYQAFYQKTGISPKTFMKGNR